MNKPSEIQTALNKLHEAMEGMAKDAKGWKVSDISALNGMRTAIINLKKDLAESQQELSDLKASLPKIKADAVLDYAKNMERIEQTANLKMEQGLRMMVSFAKKTAEEYANKLEAGE